MRPYITQAVRFGMRSQGLFRPSRRSIVVYPKTKGSAESIVIDPSTRKRLKALFSYSGEGKFNKKDFEGRRALLPISVGQLSHDVRSPHEDEKFEATVEALNGTGLESCIVLVDDDIQFDTYEILHQEKSEGELRDIVLGVGTEWIEKHEKILERLTIPYEIKRWEDVAKDPDFEDGVKKIQARYLSDGQYRGAFDSNINQFLTRLENRGVDFDWEYAFRQCWNYLIHENAGMAFVWPKWQADFECYPGGRNASMAATYDAFIKDQHPGLLRSVSLYFQKGKKIYTEQEIEAMREPLVGTEAGDSSVINADHASFSDPGGASSGSLAKKNSASFLGSELTSPRELTATGSRVYAKIGDGEGPSMPFKR